MRYSGPVMHLSYSLLLFSVCAPVLAQQQPGEDYVLKQTNLTDLIDDLAPDLIKSSLAIILDYAPFETLPVTREMKQVPWFRKGFKWSAADWHNDEKTTFWRPQGISTISDSDAEVYQGNTEILAASWVDVRNATGNALSGGLGVRVSFVRKGSADLGVANKAYQHVLLVEPFMDDDGKPNYRALVNIKSGGMVWRGRWLFITDAELGVRVFDVERLFIVKEGEHVGRDRKGNWAAGLYKYIMPQAYTYKLASNGFKDIEFEPSVLAIDRNGTQPRLLMADTVPVAHDGTHFMSFMFSNSTGLLDVNKKTESVEAIWAWRTNVHAIRGISYSPTENKYFMVQSFGDDTNGNILRWIPGTWADEYDEMLLPGPEGASIRPDQEELWIAGGIPGQRYVMALSTTMTNVELSGSTEITESKPRASSTNPDNADNTKAPSPSTTESVTPPPATPLSPGIIAGISIGAFAVLASSALSIFLLLRRRRRRQSPDPVIKPELMATEVQRFDTPAGGSECFEKDAAVWPTPVYEMSPNIEHFEMPVQERFVPRKPVPGQSQICGFSTAETGTMGRTDSLGVGAGPRRREEVNGEEGERLARLVTTGRAPTGEVVSPLTPGGRI